MNDMTGTKWCKCDLHLHTMVSRCYTDKTNTPEQWVARALEQGLTAVAVTDHNDYRAIDPIMAEGARQGLTVFPGVEITCDTGKMHMLVLFDVTAKGDTVRDFLSRCDIDGEHIGDPEGTSMSVFEICAIAKKRGALVIAAHLDSFSAINSMNAANLDKLFASDALNAVQTAHAPIWRRYEADHDRDAMLESFRALYGSGASAADIDRWRKCYTRAKEAGLPMLCFSDDPHGPGEAAHGLWGIGSVYTWLQMGKIDLEGLRQALLAHRSRVRMMFDSETEPSAGADHRLISLEIRNTQLNPRSPIRLRFHPQLTCLVGGRSSGKSSIVRVLSGVFGILRGSILRNALPRQDEFYCVGTEDGGGIFLPESEIDVRFAWYGSEYRLRVTDIRSMDDQHFDLFRTEPDGTETQIPYDPQSFYSLMSASVCVRRQLYELTRDPAALLEFIDSCCGDMYILHTWHRHCAERQVCLAMEMNILKRSISIGSRVSNETQWLRNQLTEDNQSEYLPMLECRERASGIVDECAAHLEQLCEEHIRCVTDYRSCTAAIRDTRRAFLEKAMAGEENYRIELSPGTDRASLRNTLRRVLNAPLDALRDDIAKLEDILYTDDCDTQRFIRTLRAVRDPDSPNEGFSDYFARLIRGLSEFEFERFLTFRPEDELIISYRPNGAKNFRRVSSGASGEAAGAVLSLLLRSESIPLVIDRPEDDMDSRVLYDEFIPRFRSAKAERQLILVTRSANVAVNGDAGMINVLESKGGNVRVRASGSIDDPEIRGELCDLLEGSRSAFEQRARKYRCDP